MRLVRSQFDDRVKGITEATFEFELRSGRTFERNVPFLPDGIMPETLRGQVSALNRRLSVRPGV